MAPAFEDKLAADVAKIFDTTWNARAGVVVPQTDDLALSNGAVKLDAVMLYADLAHSTRLARKLDGSVAANIVRAYLSTMTQLVNQAGGEVRSFDGDRVMGVFVGTEKNSSAARWALKLNYAVTMILKPKAEAKFPSLAKTGFQIAHCVGVHGASVLVVRGGVRGSNDLVFVGSAPNLAAKLSETAPARTTPISATASTPSSTTSPSTARTGATCGARRNASSAMKPGTATAPAGGGEASSERATA